MEKEIYKEPLYEKETYGDPLYKIEETIYGEPLTVFCSPISGGKYISQVACMQELFAARFINNGYKNVGYKNYPDMMLGSSGGNLVNIAALAGDFTEEGIIRNILKMRTEYFIKNWFTEYLSFIPSWTASIFTGTLYNKSTHGRGFIRSLFTSQRLKKVECWIGTYDEQNKKSKFFCNLSRGESLINPYFFTNEEHLYGSMPLEFLDGDLDAFADATVASGSIPFVIHGQEIKGNNHSDGGCCFPSPLSAFSGEISRIILNTNRQINNNKLFESTEGQILETEKVEAQSSETSIYEINQVNDSHFKIKHSQNKNLIRPLRLYYFESYEIEESKPTQDKTYTFALFGQVLSQVLNSSMIYDRNMAIDILKRVSGNREVSYTCFNNMTTEKLSNILKRLENKLHYVLIFYPHGSPEVNIFKLNDQDVVKNVNYVRKNYSLDVWYCNY